MSPGQSKVELRADYRARLAEQSADALSSALAHLEARVLAWCLQRPAGSIITLFGGLRGEPDLARGIGPQLNEAGLRPALFALSTTARGEMEAWPIQDPASLKRGHGGVWEPVTEPGQSLAAETIAVILVPGLRFCPRTGGRLGRGGGYYDRFLARAPQALRVGVALEWQLQEGLPMEPHDLPMDALMTDQRWLPLTPRALTP